MSVRTTRTDLTYGRTLPRDGYHQSNCFADSGQPCTCSVWWRGREYTAQWNHLGYTRCDDGPPYGEEIPPTDEAMPATMPLVGGGSLTPIRARDAETPEWVG